MPIKIPNETKKFKQIGNSDVLGNIWSSFNLDLSENLGRIRISPRCMLVDGTVGASTLTNMETPVTFKFFDNGTNERIWCIAGARMFYNSGDPDYVFTQDATASTPTSLNDGCDMENFNAALYIAGNGDLTKYTGSWSVVSTAPNSGNAQMCVFQNRLYVTQGDSTASAQIFSCSSGDVVVEPTAAPNTNLYTLDLTSFGGGDSSNNDITSIRSASDRIWIATRNLGDTNARATGLKGRVYEWDGVSTSPTRVYELDTLGGVALVIKDDIPYVVDADGKLMKFDGSGFVEVARLPVLPSRYLKNPAANSPVQRFIHPRGITLRDNRIVMLINNLNVDDTTIIENLPSGVWEYDEAVGLYHKYSIGISPVDFSTRTDYAQNRLANVGALFASKTAQSSDNDGDLMMGVGYYTSATVDEFGVFCNNTKDTKSKVGYLVTTKIESQNVQDVWQKVYVKYKKLLDSTDKIVLKYRTSEPVAVEGTITWVSTTQFTSTIDLSTYAVGDEVEVTRGTGGGQIEHITVISYSNPTYTVTVENAVTGATGTGSARFQKWAKIGTASNQTLDYSEFPIDKQSNWIQLKCVMYFTGKNELNELELVNKLYKPSN